MTQATEYTRLPKDEFLVKQTFKHLNNFKRARAQFENADTESARTALELRMYKEFDQLELSLRAVQAEIRNKD